MSPELVVRKVSPTSPGLRSRVWFPSKTFSPFGRIKKLGKIIKRSVGRNNLGKKTVLGKKTYGKKYASFGTKEFFFNNCKKVLLTYLGNGKEPSTLKPFFTWKTNSGFLFKTAANVLDKKASRKLLNRFVVEPGFFYKKGFELNLGEKGSQAGKYGEFASANGTFFTVVKKTASNLIVKLPSKKLKSFDINSYYKVGPNLFQKKKKIVYSSAGFNFSVNSKKSKVRGVAKNPVDHPHGGGEGKKAGVRKSPQGWVNGIRHFKFKKHL